MIGPVIALMLGTPLSGQNITAAITAANAPTGTAASPHFVIDSDAANVGAGYTRDTIPASVQVHFSKAPLVFSAEETFRASVQLIDEDGNVITLSSGGGSAGESVSLSALFPTATRTFNLTPDPSVDLGAGKQYRLRYTIQRRGAVLFVFNGVTFYEWNTVDGPDDSSPFTVVHFPDHPEDPQARYCRGYLRAAAAWQKIHALQTAGSTADRSFQLSVPYTHARYDVGGDSQAVNLRFIVEMEDNLGNTVPLENGGSIV